jgi:cystathionine beta-lyase/cystathionine gamma-synthase
MYQRFGHPTVAAVADRVAALEGAEAALLFGSGMGAISSVLLALLRRGDRVIAHHELFAQTDTLFGHLERELGLAVERIDLRELENVRAALKRPVRLVYAETPTNPLLEICDLAALAQLRTESGRSDCTLVVDGTFAGPLLQSPLALGFDLVVHSGSKSLGGHSDLLCGVVAGARALVSRVQAMQVLLGAVLDPGAAWLLARSLQTLPVRVRAEGGSAAALARFLAAHPAIASVRYPGLEGDPGWAVARRQMRGGGSVVCFEPAGGVEAARRFVDALRLIPIATSLGGVETIVELPYDLDFVEAEDAPGRAATRQRVPALVRMSVGLENVDDLVADLDQALQAARGADQPAPR